MDDMTEELDFNDLDDTKFFENRDLLYANDILMRKTTDISGRVPGYITAYKTGEYVKDIEPAKTAVVKKEEVDKRIEDVTNIADEILENIDDAVVIANLVEALGEALNELWAIKESREREFAKALVMFQAVIRKDGVDVTNKEQLAGLVEAVQIFRIPNIAEIDVTNCTRKLEEAHLDIYKPFKENPKLKIIIQEE
ncbi:MAG: hypothetical protein V2A72_04405 [Candidatus Omnitrophota bacterium]